MAGSLAIVGPTHDSCIVGRTNTPGGTAEGIDGLVAQASRTHAAETVDASHASGVRFIGERYRFQAVRTPGGWRFSRVESHLHWTSSS